MRFLFVLAAVLAAILSLTRGADAAGVDCHKNQKAGCNCPQDYNPVYATNGCEYSNACVAYCNGATVDEPQVAVPY